MHIEKTSLTQKALFSNWNDFITYVMPSIMTMAWHSVIIKSDSQNYD